ncbi:MAG: hypothetical protein ABIL01_24200 [Pseudomonadota bacterium]
MFERTERGWCVVLLLVSITAHAYSIAVTGAKYWIDSIAYFQIALVLFDADKLGQLYGTQFGFLYQHLTPGLPLLIHTLDAIFQERMWPALVILQGTLSAVAVTYFVLTFKSSLSRPAQLMVVILCGLHPYFVSFHSAALTESVSATVLLVSLGIALRALDGRLSLHASLSLLLPLSILAAQFRPYLGMVGILIAALVVVQRGKPHRIALYAVIALALAAGSLAFPVYRAAMGLGFFLPNVSTLLLTHVSYVAWDLDDDTAQSLRTVVLNGDIRARLIGKQPVNYDDARRIFDDLVSSGLSPAEARQRIGNAAWRVRTSSIGAIERQLQLPLASVGFQLAPVCCQPGRQLTRDFTAAAMYSHIRRYFRWNSGLDRGDYVETFDTFSQMTRASNSFSQVAEDLYVARIRPYVTNSLKSFRDPLKLSWLISDPLIVIGGFGLFLFFWHGQRISLVVLAIPFAVVYAAAAYAHIFGDNRHAHPLIPIFVVGVMKVVDDFFSKGYGSRFRDRLRQPSRPH